MKRSWIIAIVLLVAVFSLAMGPYFSTVYTKTLSVSGKAVVSDSLRLNGRLYFAGSGVVKTDAFSARVTRDTCVWAGTTTSSFVVAQPYITTAIQDSIPALSVLVKTDTVIVMRDSSQIETAQPYGLLRVN